jgi:hypothetical protein
MVLADHSIRQTGLDIFPICTSIIAAEVSRTTNLANVVYSENCVFSVGAIQKICVFGSESILFLTFLSMKDCMYTEVKTHVCED